MFSRLRQLRLHWTRQRVVSALLLLAVCRALLPITTTVSSSRVDKDLSTPFPCQHRPCGCRSADQCWRRCCCFTNAQKLAWARAHRVTAPDYVASAAAAEATAGSCSARPQCTLAAGCCKSTPSAATANQPRPIPRKLVLGVYEQQCQGTLAYGIFGSWSLTPPSPALLIAPPNVILPWSVDSERGPSAANEPPVPPPKIIHGVS